MKNRVLINQSDYEFYKIRIPFAFAFGKKKNKFLTGELGKRHPCFSDDFCFDVRTCVDKSGFVGKVVVVNKYKLSELKSQNPGKGFFVKEEKMRVFENDVIAFFCNPFFILSFLILLILFFSFYYQSKNRSSVQAEPIQVVEQVEQNSKLEVFDLFEQIKSKNGKLSFIEWVAHKSAKNFSAEIQKLYPEDFNGFKENVVTSVVSYKSGVPVMVIKAKDFKDYVGFENPNQNYDFFVPFVRDVLIENGAQIREESPWSVKFSYKYVQTEKDNVVSEIGKIALEKNISVAYLMLKNSGNSDFDVQIDFSKESTCGIDLRKVGNYLDLFISDNPKPKNYSPKVESVRYEREAGAKVGEVAYSDGTKVVFYKNKEGKIIKEKER